MRSPEPLERGAALPGVREAFALPHLEELLRRTRLSADPADGALAASGGARLASDGAGARPSGLPQEIFLQSMREEIEHFLAHSNLEVELAEERRLFEQLKGLGERLNSSYVAEELPTEPPGPPAAWLKRLLRKLLRPLFRLVLGPRMRHQTQFNASLVQFGNAVAQLEVQVVSVQRLYKAHLANLSRNTLRVLDLLHHSDQRLNEKIDLLVEDLQRRVVALQRSVEERGDGR